MVELWGKKAPLQCQYVNWNPTFSKPVSNKD